MEELPQRIQAQETSPNFFQSARLLTASATTGWDDWIHGKLWLLPGGLLRIPLGPIRTLFHGMGPTTNARNPKIWMVSEQEFHLWFPWDGVLPELQAILQQWIDDNLVMD
jgi:hypothetical protein